MCIAAAGDVFLLPQSQITSVSSRSFIGIACMRLDVTVGLKIL